MSIPDSSGDNIITFTDPDIETAEIISHFLDLSYCRNGRYWPDFERFSKVFTVRLAGFLKKYDCEQAIRVLTCRVWSAYHDNAINTQLMFLLAVMFDDDCLWAVVLEVIDIEDLMEIGTYHGNDKSSVKDAHEFFELLPSAHSFALFRAFICRTKNIDSVHHCSMKR